MSTALALVVTVLQLISISSAVFLLQQATMQTDHRYLCFVEKEGNMLGVPCHIKHDAHH